MGRSAFLATVFTATLVVVLPFVGGGGPSLATAVPPLQPAIRVAAPSTVAAASVPVTAVVASFVTAATPTVTSALLVGDMEHRAQKPVPKPKPKVVASTGGSLGVSTSQRREVLKKAGKSCPGNVGGSVGSAPGKTSAGGVQGTTSSDLASFAKKYNSVRVSNCLPAVPLSHFRYDSCMEKRLFWMAEDPSTNPLSAWGHIGSKRSDGKASVGCDGNLAGGSGNSGSTVAVKWWESSHHRASLYKPSNTGSTAGVCILFAMTHGGLPNESNSFTRAAARWTSC